MKKLKYILIFVLMLFFISACTKKTSENVVSSQKPLVNQSLKFEKKIASSDGVDVEIVEVERQWGKTRIKEVMDNHRYDLGSLDVFSQTDFNGVKLAGYRIINSGSGGHLLQAELTFNQDLFGKLSLGLGKNLTFDFILN